MPDENELENLSIEQIKAIYSDILEFDEDSLIAGYSYTDRRACYQDPPSSHCNC